MVKIKDMSNDELSQIIKDNPMYQIFAQIDIIHEEMTCKIDKIKFIQACNDLISNAEKLKAMADFIYKEIEGE